MKNITETIKRLIVEHGIEILEQEQQLKAILADLHPTEKRMRYLLELSLRAEIPKKLIVLQNEKLSVKETQVGSMKHYFKEEYLLEDAAVKLVFDCWMLVLNIQVTTTSPKSKSNGIIIVGIFFLIVLVGLFFFYNRKNDIQVDEQTPYTFVEQMPEFPGGMNGVSKYLSANVKYPTIALEKGIQGKVFVNFVVERNGSISNVEISRGVDPAIDNESLRVVESMPKWIPGKQNGEAVRVILTVPINFVLEK